MPAVSSNKKKSESKGTEKINEVDSHITQRYEIRKRLGKGVSQHLMTNPFHHNLLGTRAESNVYGSASLAQFLFPSQEIGYIFTKYVSFSKTFIIQQGTQPALTSTKIRQIKSQILHARLSP